jgi:hypothetical protein
VLGEDSVPDRAEGDFDEQVDVCVPGDFSSLNPMVDERTEGAPPTR